MLYLNDDNEAIILGPYVNADMARSDCEWAERHYKKQEQKAQAHCQQLAFLTTWN
jgi:hypothetical protein